MSLTCSLRLSSQAMPSILGAASKDAPSGSGGENDSSSSSSTGPGSVPGSEDAQIVEEEFDLSDIMGEALDSSLASASDRVAQVDRELEVSWAESSGFDRPAD